MTDLINYPLKLNDKFDLVFYTYQSYAETSALFRRVRVKKIST